MQELSRVWRPEKSKTLCPLYVFKLSHFYITRLGTNPGNFPAITISKENVAFLPSRSLQLHFVKGECLKNLKECDEIRARKTQEQFWSLKSSKAFLWNTRHPRDRKRPFLPARLRFFLLRGCLRVPLGLHLLLGHLRPDRPKGGFLWISMDSYGSALFSTPILNIFRIPPRPRSPFHRNKEETQG